MMASGEVQQGTIINGADDHRTLSILLNLATNVPDSIVIDGVHVDNELTKQCALRR